MTEIAQNRSGTTLDPVPPAEVDHDALYTALRRLLTASRTMLGHVEVNSADVHRDVPLVRRAIQEAEGLLYPALLPQAPDDAVVVYGRAVREGDKVWMPKPYTWVPVVEVEPIDSKTIRLLLGVHGDVMVRPDGPVAIIEGEA